MQPRFSFHESFAPGADPAERVDAVRAAGFEAVELDSGSVRADDGRAAKRALRNAGLSASAICGSLQGCLLGDDPRVRQLAVDDIKRLLAIAAELGASGVVVVPIIGAPRLPDLTPWMSQERVQEGILAQLLSAVVREAEAARCAIWLEPLNRYRTHFMHRLQQAAAICEKVGSEWVQVMGDTYHMALEESDPAGAVESAGPHLAHVHVVDNNRKLPGQGSFNFAPVMRALEEQGYNGYFTFECPVEGDFRAQVVKARAHLQDLCW